MRLDETAAGWWNVKGWETCVCDPCGKEILNTSDARMQHITFSHRGPDQARMIMLQLAAEMLPPVQVPPVERRQRKRRRR